MKAAYVKAPFQFAIKEVSLRPLTQTEVLVDVKACGVCGHDLIIANEKKEFTPFGHEAAGIVIETGSLVKNVKAGDKVVFESGTFDRFSDNSRNGRVDLDNKGPNFWEREGETMGFAEKIIVPCECCVKYDGISFESASLTEPLGVAMDIFKTSDIQLGHDVLVIGLGPIGLMAARLAIKAGARNVYGSELSACENRIKVARKWGLRDVICSDMQDQEKYNFPKGGVDRVLVTAPPALIPAATRLCNVGGIVSFIGIDYGEGAMFTLDSNLVHFNKLQIRASHASPALYFPLCLDLIKTGAIPVEDLITHRFPLEDIQNAITGFRSDRKEGIKAIMLRE
jgi:threonine dehydrogenase-like Zn-dependent dehydrogenase